ncbi:MAG: NAD(P)-binding protein [Gemmatimonadetes bacterium]|nr:NAD(P)-binding protein [Gemmatimonadota bacterium]
MKASYEVAIVGSGFAGSLLARILAVLGYDVVLLERGTHPRFAIGESSTPLANLSLERIATRYGLADCYDLAAHGRWVDSLPDLRRGLKRGFTYYRHHPHQPFDNRGLDSERLLVAASPEDRIADSHWLRSDVDHHFVREAIAAGVHYSDRTTIGEAEFRADRVTLRWRAALTRYPTIAEAFGDATAVRPIAFVPLIQHRLTRAAGQRWMLMPHAFAFVDPLFSTGIAWSLRAVERIALAFEAAARGARVPDQSTLHRYESALVTEADQIDLVVAAAYEAMAHFDLFAAQSMLYFATVSFAEASQRLKSNDSVAWNGFMGVGDDILHGTPRESLRRLREITRSQGHAGTSDERRGFVEWLTGAIAPRNIAGLADINRHNLYPIDFDALIKSHRLLGMTRAQIVERLPALRGMSPPPVFPRRARAGIIDLAPGTLESPL